MKALKDKILERYIFKGNLKKDETITIQDIAKLEKNEYLKYKDKYISCVKTSDFENCLNDEDKVKKLEKLINFLMKIIDENDNLLFTDCDITYSRFSSWELILIYKKDRDSKDKIIGSIQPDKDTQDYILNLMKDYFKDGIIKSFTDFVCTSYDETPLKFIDHLTNKHLKF